MSQLNEITVCEVCDNAQLTPVLDLGLHPLCDDLIQVGDSRVCNEYPIEILYCDRCATAHQRFQVPKKELFPKSYHYRSRFTEDVLNGMAALVMATELRIGSLAGKLALDIGCNDGSLLYFFQQKKCKTIGIEPTDAWQDGVKHGHTFYNAFLSQDIAEEIVRTHGKPDIVTFTNVFAHIENLSQVISSLKLLMSERTVLIIENHYLGSILERKQFDTFYHEHPRTYSLRSFMEIAKKLNSAIQDVEFSTRYGGNIRVFISNQNLLRSSATDAQKILEQELLYKDKFEALKASIEKWQSSKKQQIANLLKSHQTITAKAFPGRAAILIKMLGLDENIISCVYEKPGSMKIGHYIPGTRITIKSDDELFDSESQPEHLLNLAWHISSEIKSYLTDNGYKGNVIDILNTGDF